jgi:hypothetical protein
MDAYCIRPDDLPDLTIEKLGPATVDQTGACNSGPSPEAR